MSITLSEREPETDPDPVTPEPASAVPGGRAGRIAHYSHSDTTYRNKGGAMVRVMCITDFAARTPDFIAFADQVARFAYACSAKNWAEIAHAYPEVVRELNRVRGLLKENINITDVKVMNI
jgi:translation elongation factor EF-Ts